MRSSKHASSREIVRAARLLCEGQLVVFPTETVYGLGANAFDETAVKRIFAAKKRPASNPLIVHVSSRQMLLRVIDAPPSARAKRLMDAFWPGPLTLLFQKNLAIPAVVTAGLPTVAVRMPHNKIARALIRAAGVPVAAPSANPSMQPSPTLSAHVRTLRGVSLVLEGGQSVWGIESTVVDPVSQQILRPGPVSLSQLRPFLPRIRFHASLRGKKRFAPASPGMAFRHYAPRCVLTLVSGSPKKLAAFFAAQSNQTAVICSEKIASRVSGPRVFSFSSARDLAKNMFVFLHALDEQKFKRAFVQSVSARGIGFSVMNRLQKASRKKIRL